MGLQIAQPVFNFTHKKMKIHFYKYQGTGNDFILVDNRSGTLELTAKQIEQWCHRRFGIGADGLMELRLANGYDFEMVYYNADGLPGSMCGNGGRCITRFAADMGMQKKQFSFLAPDGPHESSIEENGHIKLKMNDVATIDHYNSYDFLNTGSPHVVKMVTDLRHYDVVTEGREIRNNIYYKNEGTNVNFVETLDEDEIFVRTYERGVEDETYSCGTGVTAAALVNAHNDTGFNRVEIMTLGGHLSVEFDKTNHHGFNNIWLCGPAIRVFEGDIEAFPESVDTP